MDSDTDVLIVGAGPTGLVMAVELARRGIAFRLVDAAPSPFEGSRGKGVQPRTLEVFESLGVVDEVLAAGGPYPPFRVHVGPLSFSRASLAPPRLATEATPYPMTWMVPQARTEGALRYRLASRGGTVEFGVALQSFDQDRDGIRATLSTGETVRAKYLVGADGAHSTVRRSLGLELKGERVDAGEMLVADVAVEGLSRAVWQVWPFAKGGMVGLCPLAHTDLFQFTAPAAFTTEGIEAAIARLTRRSVSRVAWRSTYRPSVRMVERYRVGRVFLAGDAAHVHPPTGGQGMNTGVQDAYNLGWKLAHAVKRGDDGLIGTYEAERRPVAASVLDLSKDLYASRSAKRGAATDQLSLNYRGGPLSSGETCKGLHPGDRMPDLILDDGVRLFSRMRGPHATELNTPEGVRILIRPDGYISHIGRVPYAPPWGGPVVQCFGRVAL